MATVIEELVIALRFETDDKGLQKSVAAARKAAKKIAGEFDDAADDIAGSADDIAVANAKAAKKTNEVWTGALRQLGSRFADLGIAAAGALANFGVELFERARAADTLAAAVGGSVEEIQELFAAGRALKIDTDNTGEAIKTLQENLGELERLGTGPAKESLGSLGLTLDDFAGLDIKDRLKVFANALGGLETQSERLSVVMEIMGNDGAELLPLLSIGAEGIDKLTGAAREAGQVLDEETIAQTKELERTMGQASGAIEGAGLAILTALLPEIQNAASGMGSWIEENDELIKQDLPAIARGMADMFSAAAAAAKVAAEAVARLLRNLRALGNFIGDVAADISFGTEGPSVEGRGVAMFVGGGTTGSAERAEAKREAVAAAQRQAQADAEVDAIFAQEFALVDREIRRERARAFSAAEREGKSCQCADGAVGKIKNGTCDCRKKGGRGGRGKSVAQRQAEEDVEFTGLGEEFRELAQQFGATDKAIAAASASAAASFARGASQVVARKAGLSTLGGLVGVDLTKVSKVDPLLSELFGEDGLPDAPLSDLTQNRQPQVLTATINNQFDITQNFDINGGDRPDLIPDQVTEAFREMFSTEVQRTSKFAKVNFAR